MNKDTSHPARKGIILFITFILVAAVAYIGLIFSLFKPYYKVEIDHEAAKTAATTNTKSTEEKGER